MGRGIKIEKEGIRESGKGREEERGRWRRRCDFRVPPL
jgi:hypothetical protein